MALSSDKQLVVGKVVVDPPRLDLRQHLADLGTLDDPGRFDLPSVEGKAGPGPASRHRQQGAPLGARRPLAGLGPGQHRPVAECLGPQAPHDLAGLARAHPRDQRRIAAKRGDQAVAVGVRQAQPGGERGPGGRVEGQQGGQAKHRILGEQGLGLDRHQGLEARQTLGLRDNQGEHPGLGHQAHRRARVLGRQQGQEFLGHPLGRKARHRFAHLGAGRQRLGVGVARAIPGPEPEEAQDAAASSAIRWRGSPTNTTAPARASARPAPVGS